jgi:hypothetical protein
LAAIELVCRRHTVRKAEGSGVTFVDGRWAYCSGGAEDGHEWERVAPTDVKSIELAKSAEHVREE